MMFQSFSLRTFSAPRMASFATVFAFCALVSLSACARDGADEKERINYTCENGFAVTAIYYGVTENAGAELQIDDRYFSFYSIPTETDSGEKFATDQGLDEGTGLLWLRNADDATVLIEMSLDESVDPTDYPVITTCAARS